MSERSGRRHGLSDAQLESLTASQGGACAVCRQVATLVVDHDHDSDEVRGVLCHRCNTAEGLLDGDPERMERLAEYVRTARTGLRYAETTSRKVDQWLQEAAEMGWWVDG